MSAVWEEAGYQRTVEERAERRETARQVEARISVILRVGVLTAAALLAVSQPWIVLQHRPPGSQGLSVGEALRRLPDLDPRGLAALGVIILVATPILQLLTSAFLFWRKHDRLYVGLTLTVCAIVAFGALFTSGGH
jgi:uncharacterized membrane protein